MNIDSAFPSEFLRASDLQGREAVVIIDKLIMRELADGEEKPVLYFEGKKKGLPLNRTNANTIAQAYGHESDEWIGRSICIYPAETDFQGKRVPCIRVRVPSRKAMADRPAAPPQHQAPCRTARA